MQIYNKTIERKENIMLKEFKNPSNQYRPIPFWSWNDKLEKEELEYQIEEMKGAGVGGFFMHARSGLKVDYLSEEWFDCIQTGINKVKEVGLDAWAYDEEGWPSGFAGGIVPALSPDFHAKFMTMEVHTTTKTVELDAMIAIYIYHITNQTYERIDKKDNYVCKAGEELLAFRRHTNPFYVDTMNKRAIDAFLESTHQVYYEKYKEDFGTHMKGFFTDEPRLACNNFGELPWSDDLPGEFLKKYQYDILDHLPALYKKTESYEKYRYDFWEMVNEMFVQNYMKTIYDWCEEHGCKSTGHIMMEESIFSQMTSSGGVMPFYEYLHIPGIDWLRRCISSPVIGKQVGSVACQLEKKQVLTESFALCGWNVSFEELKWIAEWQFVNGVNQICQHLQGYTIKGVRKRDYPPSLFTQQTWWGEYKKFNDYLGRLCAILSVGDQMADVLLLHPMRSGFITYDGTRTDEIRILDDEFTNISQMLSSQHISYHFGDETIIKKHGSVVENQFVVGKIGYKTVIMPHMYAIDGKTVFLLLEFITNGGKVLTMGRFPTFTNGSYENLKQLQSLVIPSNKDNLRYMMKNSNLLTLSVEQEKEEVEQISYLQRDTDGATILFFVNHDQALSYDTTITIMGQSCKVTRLIAETGDTKLISYDTMDGDTHFNLSFAPMQSYIILLEKEKANQKVEQEESLKEVVALGEDWTIEKMALNSMTLDTCRYQIDGGEIEDPINVIKLQTLLLEKQKTCEVALYFDFQVDMNLNDNKEFYVVVEDVCLYQLQVNGSKISDKDIGWWKDKSFKKVDIKDYVKQGENQLILTTTFSQPQKVYDVLFGENVYETEKNKITYDIEIENIYLLGDFGVISQSAYEYIERNALRTKGPFSIVDLPTTLKAKDFTTNGLLFFAGDLSVSQFLQIKKEDNKRIILHYGKQNAPLVNIYVNGSLVKSSMWEPYEVDITDEVNDGENRITMDVFASNRNLFGPHHHIDGEVFHVGTESFTGKWSWVERKSEADATDIVDKDKDYWTDSYCFVDFGLKVR